MKKNTLFDIIKENELGVLGTLSRKDINDIVDRLIKKLDSLDMSLDMIYGSLSGADPLSTAARQRAFGRLAKPKQMYKVTSEAQLKDLIEKEIIEEFLGFGAKAKQKRAIKYLKSVTDPKEKKDLYQKWKSSDSKMAKVLAKAAETMWPEMAAMYDKGESDSKPSSAAEKDAEWLHKKFPEIEKFKKEKAAREKGEAAPEEAPGEEAEAAPEEAKPEKPSKTDAPVSLFKGQGALYQRLYSSLAAAVGAQSKRDKNDVEQVVKLIMKDLSAQLRHNKIKVQENQLIEALTQALAEMVRTPAAAAQSVEAYKEKFKEIEKLRKKHKDDPKKLRTLDMDEEAMKSAYAEFKKSYKAGGAATDITSKSQRRVTPEKGVLQVGKAAGGKLKGWKGGALDQETITKLIVKNLKPFIAKALKARGREDIRIQENKELDSIIEVIINEMQSTQ